MGGVPMFQTFQMFLSRGKGIFYKMELYSFNILKRVNYNMDPKIMVSIGCQEKFTPMMTKRLFPIYLILDFIFFLFVLRTVSAQAIACSDEYKPS